MMKFNKLFALLALVTLFSCSKVSDKCIITGEISSGDGELVIYPYQEVYSQKESESLSYKTKIVNGKFELEIDAVRALRVMHISMENERKRIEFFSEPGTLNITEKDGELVGVGSKLNDEFHDLLVKLKYKDYAKFKNKKVFNAEQQKIVNAYSDKLWALAKENATSIPLTRLFYEKYWASDVDTFNKILNTFSKDIHSSYYLTKMISRRDNQLKVAIGKQAPAFALKSDKGEDVSLEMYKGKYVLVDFWASWCGPCRAGIPNLKEIYKDYKDKGLEILSVSTDADSKAWLKAVEKEQMPWNQVNDTKSINDAYNITYIPAIFLIDTNGKIIAKGLHGDEIRKEVEKVLK